MPAAAFGLKKYLGGALSSKIDDNEHATAALWDSEVLRVQDSPCDVHRPEFRQGVEDESEISPAIAAEGTRYILPNSPSWTDGPDDPEGVEEETASFSREPPPACQRRRGPGRGFRR